MQTVYRICERKNGQLLTLFHGINRSRVLPMNTWVTATIKDVTDGSRKTSKVYKSGFHTIPTLKECRKFSNRFSAPRDLVIVKCEIDGDMWEKEHSPANIILSEKIKLLHIVEEIKLK